MNELGAIFFILACIANLLLAWKNRNSEHKWLPLASAWASGAAFVFFVMCLIM